MSKPYHVIGIYKTRQGASNAVDHLVREGFARENVSVLLSEEARTKWFALDKHTKAVEGAAVGGLTGGALGALVLGLTAAGSVAIPGIGVLISGPLLAAITGAGAGGAAGSAVGGLLGLGIPEREVKHITRSLKDHCIAVGVQVEDVQSAERAREVFTDTGAIQQATQEGRRIEL
jgi:Na+/serine symporter